VVLVVAVALEVDPAGQFVGEERKSNGADVLLDGRRVRDAKPQRGSVRFREGPPQTPVGT
jgi:hypothetical protein